MLVSHRLKFIYTKTTKTAGTSIESYFEPYCVDQPDWQALHFRDEHVSAAGIIGYRGTGRPAQCTWWNHMPAALIRQRLGEAIWSSYFKFCAVRNPYDKAISHFYFLRDQGRIQIEDGMSEQEQFEHWLVQSGPLIDRDKYLIDGRLCMDHFVRYEHLQTDLQAVCERLGIDWQPERLATFKAGIRPPTATARAMYSPRSREIVSAAYAYELDFFGYSFPSD